LRVILRLLEEVLHLEPRVVELAEPPVELIVVLGAEGHAVLHVEPEVNLAPPVENMVPL
jgi:hypothetical protein